MTEKRTTAEILAKKHIIENQRRHVVDVVTKLYYRQMRRLTRECPHETIVQKRFHRVCSTCHKTWWLGEIL